MRPPNDPLLTAKEAGRYLGTGERYVRRLIQERRITYVKIGRLVRIQRSVLEQMIADGVVEAQQ